MKRIGEVLLRTELGGQNGDCWIYQGKPNKKGYCMVMFENGCHTVNRLAYRAGHPDEDLAGKSVVCTCGNKLCCNPEHLEALDTKKVLDDNRKFTRNTKLTIHEVREIRRLRSEGWISETELANRFNVTVASISNILSGRTRKGVL